MMICLVINESQLYIRFLFLFVLCLELTEMSTVKVPSRYRSLNNEADIIQLNAYFRCFSFEFVSGMISWKNGTSIRLPELIWSQLLGRISPVPSSLTFLYPKIFFWTLIFTHIFSFSMYHIFSLSVFKLKKGRKHATFVFGFKKLLLILYFLKNGQWPHQLENALAAVRIGHKGKHS